MLLRIHRKMYEAKDRRSNVIPGSRHSFLPDNIAIIGLFKAIRPKSLWLFSSCFKTQGLVERIPKPDICQPALGLPRNLRQQFEMVELNSQIAVTVEDAGLR